MISGRLLNAFPVFFLVVRLFSPRSRFFLVFYEVSYSTLPLPEVEEQCSYDEHVSSPDPFLSDRFFPPLAPFSVPPFLLGLNFSVALPPLSPLFSFFRD